MNCPLNSDVRKALAELVLTLDTPEARHLALSIDIRHNLPDLDYYLPMHIRLHAESNNLGMRPFLFTDSELLIRLVRTAYFNVKVAILQELSDVHFVTDASVHRFGDFNTHIRQLILLANEPVAARAVSDALREANVSRDGHFNMPLSKATEHNTVDRALEIMTQFNFCFRKMKDDFSAKAKEVK